MPKGIKSFGSPPVYQPVAVGGFRCDELAPLHSPAIALMAILRDGDGLLLGQGTGNAHHQFCGERSGVDIRHLAKIRCSGKIGA